MKREKNEGAKPVPASTAPKRRTATKPKAATRVPTAAPVAGATKAPKATKKKIVAPAPPPIRHEDIAFRAYLIGEKRQQLGQPGDSLSDWVEAERQLISERATHGVN
jgi:hypothetical protein